MAAGADIKEMSTKSFMDAYKSDMLSVWQNVCGFIQTLFLSRWFSI
jgi:hypothetical protein